jgi:hypothetical protein
VEITNGERRGGIKKRDEKNAFLNLEFIFLNFWGIPISFLRNK